ncbi:MAG: hypothetical protein KGQ89_10795 [Verrucomicrobia bacterium]|nr:hypothetical protein [Verrucomicrobiota bacterium]
MIALFLSIPTTLYFGLAAVIDLNWDHVEKALLFLGLSIAFAIFYRIAAAAVRCPLCLNHPLLSQSCQKHIKAETLLGSYPLMVASSLLLRGKFLCPYCGETSECRVKERPPTLPSSGSRRR